MPLFFSNLLKLGTCAKTPIDPIIANGDAIILFATQAIIYPPLAATLSTHIVNGILLSLILFNWEAAKPCSCTVPPEFSNLNNTSSPFL